jgi:lipid A 3-O-deacylase
MLFGRALSVLLIGLSATPALAGDFGLSEVRGGIAMSNLELLFNTTFVPDANSFSAGRIDSAQFDLLFRSPDIDAFKWIASPRPELGTMLSLSGHESIIHAGLNWHVPVGTTPFYLEAGLGLGITDGYLDNAPPGYHNLGCRALLHWEYGVGYNIDDRWTVTAEWQHVSSTGLCTPNEGLNDLGVTVGYKF